MISKGIPPSPDRLRFQVKAGFLIVVGVAGVVTILAVFALGKAGTRTGDAPPPFLQEEEPNNTSESARKSAYEAVQRFVRERLDSPTLYDIYWRDNVHEVQGDDFLFVGYMDVVNTDGRSEHMVYRVTVRRLGENAWDAVDMQFEKSPSSLH